jgi:hypothetical protein
MGKNQSGGVAPKSAPPHLAHDGQPVKVGQYEIFAGGTRDLRWNHLDEIRPTILIPLTSGWDSWLEFGCWYTVFAAPLRDFGGVPKVWSWFIDEVIKELQNGERILTFCVGSHGRTGCFLASLIARLEPETEDPIAAVRERHCPRAVETLQQAEAVFALRGLPLPVRYINEFRGRATS